MLLLILAVQHLSLCTAWFHVFQTCKPCTDRLYSKNITRYHLLRQIYILSQRLYSLFECLSQLQNRRIVIPFIILPLKQIFNSRLLFSRHNLCFPVTVLHTGCVVLYLEPYMFFCFYSPIYIFVVFNRNGSMQLFEG